MPGAQEQNSRERSVSGDFDTDFESNAGDANPPGKPGRKKNPNSQAARRDQNRIAQREFRLRKQQRIRDLEARVEILSGGKDEAIGEMRNMLKDLMAENHNLRGLLRSLAGFIGDGAGGLLPKIGWDINDFNAYINKSETDTAWEGYQKRKKGSSTSTVGAGASESASSSVSAGPSSLKRGPDLDVDPARKRARGDDKDLERNGFQMHVPLASSITHAPMFPGPPERSALFRDLIPASHNSPMFMQSPPAGSNSSQYPTPSSSALDASFPSSSYMSNNNVNVNVDPSLTSPYDTPTMSVVSQQRLQHAPDPSEDIDDDDDPKKNEAFKLIHYHLENYKRNSSYCLPASLRPTAAQRTIPHESALDRVLHPELRDRMILFRKRYELADCLIDMRKHVTIHGDDVLAHSNWEIGPAFIEKYPYLIDPVVLGITNRWRRERGEQELTIQPEVPADRANS